MIGKCAQCGNPMELFSQMPRFGTLPELRNYRCLCCGHVESDAGGSAFYSVGMCKGLGRNRGMRHRVSQKEIPDRR
jgi:hypothetical protein